MTTPSWGDLVIVALTPAGAALGQRLAAGLGGGQVVQLGDGLRPRLVEWFQAGRPLICIMALGIVVRLLGPVVCNKHREPAVVVVDEAGRFAISVLGGHRARANELAQQVADLLGGTAVLTTASDALGLPVLEHLGRSWGWRIEPASALTQVAAAAVRGAPIAVFQEAGRRDWWQEFGPWPASFHLVPCWPPPPGFAAALCITDRQQPAADVPCVTYRPPTLVLGIGCRRGVSVTEIEEFFLRVCQEQRLAVASLAEVATVTLKATEAGLVEFACRYGVPLRTFSPEELAQVGPLPNPSEIVRRHLGVAGVAEPAALLAAGSRTLLVPKQRHRRLTLAVARREEA
jgi:cobalt-precorrin 5A hydrolase